LLRHIFAIALCLSCGTLLSVASAGESNSLMDISSDGKLLACSNRDSGTVSVVDLSTSKKLLEVEVGQHPEGVCFLGDTHQIAVAVYSDDVVKILDADQGQVTRTVDVYDEPYGVISSEDGSRVWCTLEYPGEVIAINTKTGKIDQKKHVGQFLRGIASHDGKLFVTEYYTAKVLALNSETLEVVDEWAGTSQDNLARQITIHPTRPKAYLAHIRSRTNVAHGNGSIFPYLCVIDTGNDQETRRKRVQMDSFRGTYVVANPWEVAISPNGQQLFIIFSGTDDMFVCKLLDDNYREVEYLDLLRTGANPRAVRVAPDGKHFYIYNALDFTVDEFSTTSHQKTASVKVTEWTKSEELLLGKKLFYTAHPPMSSRRWISCSSCHIDGDADGRTWQQPEGLRSTQPLFGLKHTHPVHWSADRDEVHDFEHTIRSALMQGRGLIRGKVNESLGEPNAGLSPALDALAAYSNSHEFTLSPHAKSGLSESAKRGKKLFFSEKTQCAKCHSGPYFTDQKMHDVGTGHDDDSELLGPDYDTPTVLGVYRSAPYLHHGKAATLQEMLTKYNPEDKHGVTSHLSKQDVNDLVEYLKCLPYESIEAPN